MAPPEHMTLRERIAVPLFGRDVAPRFFFARELLLVEHENGRETDRKHVMLSDGPGEDRIRLLESHGVRVLLCSGFNRVHLPIAVRCGIEVRWGLSGEVDSILADYLAGRL